MHLQQHTVYKNENSISPLNEGFNSEIQLGFVSVRVKDWNNEILNIVDIGTVYGEGVEVPTLDARVMMAKLE